MEGERALADWIRWYTAYAEVAMSAEGCVGQSGSSSCIVLCAHRSSDDIAFDTGYVAEQDQSR